MSLSTTFAQVLGHICRSPDSVSSTCHTRFHALVRQIPSMRQLILESVHNREEVQAFIEGLEHVSAHGWELHLAQSTAVAGLQREHEIDMELIDEVVKKLETRKKRLKKEVKKLDKETGELEEENQGLKRSLIEHAEQDVRISAADVAVLEGLQSVLDVLLIQLTTHLDTNDQILRESCRGDMRSGMGGQQEDEEYVHSYAKYKNWEQVDQELAAAEEATRAAVHGQRTSEEYPFFSPVVSVFRANTSSSVSRKRLG
jgi:dGTP triphosphohydrolase